MSRKRLQSNIVINEFMNSLKNYGMYFVNKSFFLNALISFTEQYWQESNLLYYYALQYFIANQEKREEFDENRSKFVIIYGRDLLKFVYNDISVPNTVFRFKLEDNLVFDHNIDKLSELIVINDE